MTTTVRRFALVVLIALGLSACSENTSEEGVNAEAPIDSVAVGDDGPGVFCEEVGRRVTREACEDFEAVAASARSGSAAFNAPGAMKRGETVRLTLAISDRPRPRPAPEQPNPPPPPPPPDDVDDETPTGSEQPVDEPDEGPERPGYRNGGPRPMPTPEETVDPLPGETVPFEPLVGRYMMAKLEGSGFDIKPDAAVTKAVPKNSLTLWHWDVVARRSGRHQLTLTTTVVALDENGKPQELSSTPTIVEVDVQVGIIGRIEDVLVGAPRWLKMLTAVLGALTALLVAWFGFVKVVRNRGEKGK